ncbi:hypothetical protein P153DRAFT_362951 [Dothidotthia symphoricarpi CBS 119687]|uniref:Uncharacterized protein n=1 Tax=Dothidotthia symphoricarpi CBS 119687 TaxID=1392245 RepID=A0A6A6ATP2_9PLEO|nr:uncharacterized protein P153DRAFT_362951 [Dothidotthia symphoricarpi CBS 119687]KAF2133921.1 hypothetical protein P153DRAFT_362951 [Dothidotthia symphoricarpi CBS 119687]
MDSPKKRDSVRIPERKSVAPTAASKLGLTDKRMLANCFLASVLLGATSMSWPVRWILSGAPLLVYAILLGDSYGHRILPFAPVWSMFATINLTYFVCSTSWLLYGVFATFCWPTLLITCLFQFDAPAGLARRTLRKTFLRDLHFINDQIAFFDLPALEIDTEVKGLFVIRGLTLSLSTLTLVAHGIEAGIKLSDEIELAIQVDKVTVPLFRQIQVDDVYANVKGGDWEVTFGSVEYGIPEPDDDDSVLVSNTAILRAATVARDGNMPRPAEMVRNMTAGEIPTDSHDTKSAFASVKQLSPDEESANIKYREYVQHIAETSHIAIAKKALIEASKQEEGDSRLDPDNVDDLRAAICARLHNSPSIPHPPAKSIRVSTLRKTSHPKIKKFLHRFPFLYRLMLTPICYWHPVKFSSVTAAGSGKWFVSLMRKYLFKHYTGQDAEIRRLEARISAWCADANFSVELGSILSTTEFPVNTNNDIKCHFTMSDVMAYRALPDAVELKQVVRVGGADAILSIPVFLFPHHEHIMPKILTEFEDMEIQQVIKELEGTPKAIQTQQELDRRRKDEASMHISGHAHLPAQFHQDLLNFVAALVKATKVIESDKDFEEARLQRDLKRASAASVAGNASETEVSSVASDNTISDDKGFKAFLRKVDTGFKEASNKTAVGMRKAGASTMHVMANDRWIARLVGKVTRKLENAQGEIGYSGDVPVPMDKHRLRAEDETKILP